MTALQTQILSVTLSSSFCRPPLCIFISLSGWMSLILRWLETKADFLTEVHFLLRLTRGIEIQPLLPVLLQFFTLWPLPFLYFPLSSPCSHVLTRQDRSKKTFRTENMVFFHDTVFKEKKTTRTNIWCSTG